MAQKRHLGILGGSGAPPDLLPSLEWTEGVSLMDAGLLDAALGWLTPAVELVSAARAGTAGGVSPVAMVRRGGGGERGVWWLVSLVAQLSGVIKMVCIPQKGPRPTGLYLCEIWKLPVGSWLGDLCATTSACKEFHRSLARSLASGLCAV